MITKIQSEFLKASHKKNLKKYLECFVEFYKNKKNNLIDKEDLVFNILINELRLKLNKIALDNCEEVPNDFCLILFLNEKINSDYMFNVLLNNNDYEINHEEMELFIELFEKENANKQQAIVIQPKPLSTILNSQAVIKFETNTEEAKIVFQQKIYFDLTAQEKLSLSQSINNELAKTNSFVFNYFKKHNREKGLVLNTGPTGIGKSFNSALYILLDFINKKYINVDVNYKNKKMFFITDRVINVTNPYIETQNIIKDFVKIYKLSQNTEDFLLSKIALVQGNKETFGALFGKIKSKSGKMKYKYSEIEDLIVEKNTDGNLMRSIEIIMADINNKKYEGDNAEISKEISEITNKLRDIYGKRDLTQKQYIKEDLLSPFFIGDEISGESDNICCFFMTTAKAFYGVKKTKGRCSPIENTTGNIYIIDEFDKQADELLNKILENKGNYDLHLLAQELKKIYQCSFKINEDHSGDKIEKLKNDFIENKLEPFRKKYSSSNSLALDEESKDKSVHMFQDNDYGVLFGKESYVELDIKDSENTNLIKIAKKKTSVTNNKINFVSFVEDTFQLLKDFCNMLRYASKYYKKDNPLLSTSQKINILAKELHLDEKMIDFILEQTLERKEKFSDFELENVFEVEKSIHSIALKGEDEIVKLNAKSLNYSANKLIKDLALNNLVYGISATADNDSVVKNFNLKYLKKELGGNFYEFDDNDKKELSNERSAYNDDYEKKVNLVVKFPNDKITYFDLDSVLLSYEIDRENDRKEKLLKLSNAILEFINNPTSKYMLSINSRLLTSEDSFIIKELVDKHVTTKDYVLFPNPSKKEHEQEKIDSKFFKNNGMQKILKELKKNKVIVLTHVSTIGAGMNLQAKGITPEQKNYVNLNDNRAPKSDEFDIDTLYIARPTFILLPPDFERVSMNITEKLKLIYNMQGLLHNNKISHKKYNEIYKEIAKMENRKKAIIDLEHNFYKDTDDYFNVIVAVIKQFVGRGSRTLTKNINETIFLEPDLVDVLNKQKIVVEDYDLRGFKEIVKFVENKNQNSSKKIVDYRNSNNDFKFNQGKKVILSGINNPKGANYSKYVKVWEDLRDFTLKHGVFINESQKNELSKIINYDIAVTLDFPSTNLSFSIDKKQDGGNIIHVDYFTPTSNFNEDNLNLTTIKKNKKLKQYFIDNGYAIDFTTNIYALPVSCVNDIYKGAIGEVVAKFFIEEILSLKVDDKYTLKNEIYEVLDFFIDNSKIGVDAKNYQMEAFKTDFAKELEEKINRKLDGNKGLIDKALVINAFAEKSIIQYAIVDKSGFNVINIKNKSQANVLAINGVFSVKDGSLLVSARDLEMIKEWIND